MQNQHSRHFLSFFHVRAPALTVGQAVAQAKAEAEAEAKAAAAILKENSNATDVFISGFKGVNFKKSTDSTRALKRRAGWADAVPEEW